MIKCSPIRSFKASPEIILLAVKLSIRFPLSLRNVEDLLYERGIWISHETVRSCWNILGGMFAAGRTGKRVGECCPFHQVYFEGFIEADGWAGPDNPNDQHSCSEQFVVPCTLHSLSW